MDAARTNKPIKLDFNLKKSFANCNTCRSWLWRCDSWRQMDCILHLTSIDSMLPYCHWTLLYVQDKLQVQNPVQVLLPWKLGEKRQQSNIWRIWGYWCDAGMCILTGRICQRVKFPDPKRFTFTQKIIFIFLFLNRQLTLTQNTPYTTMWKTTGTPGLWTTILYTSAIDNKYC